MPRTAQVDETNALLSSLEDQRKHVLGIIEGLGEEALRRPFSPSGWSILGLIQHLTLDIERFWFRGLVAGEQSVIDWVSKGSGNVWIVEDDVPVQTILAAYRSEIEFANTIIAATPMDSPPAWWPPELFGDWRVDTVREIVLHVIAETAAHAGHLDIVRELIDNRQWLVLT
jgi:uncharacterized protein DUF664